MAGVAFATEERRQVMGSWDVSCSLTGTPIKEGDGCVLVVFKKNFEPLQHLEWDYHDVDFIVRGRYGDYGRVRVKDSGIFGNKPKKLDDDSLSDILQGRFHFFVCTMAWDWAVTRFHVKPHPDEEERLKLMKQLLSELKGEQLSRYKKLIAQTEREKWTYDFKSVVIAFMEAHRNPLAGYWATGQYYTDDIPGIVDHMKLMEERMIQLIMDHPYLVEEDDEKVFTKAEARARLEKIKGSRL
jgi:hypothetical protein